MREQQMSNSEQVVTQEQKFIRVLSHDHQDIHLVLKEHTKVIVEAYARCSIIIEPAADVRHRLKMDIALYEEAYCTVDVAYVNGSHEHEIMVVAYGLRAYGAIRASYIVHPRERIFLAVCQKHYAVSATTSVLIKGIVHADGQGLFEGKVYIASQAQHTHAEQKHRALLVGARAQSYARPEMEVNAHQVVCMHGTATGMMDKLMLWYLQSRGVAQESAQSIIMQSFFARHHQTIYVQQQLDIYFELMRAHHHAIQ